MQKPHARVMKHVCQTVDGSKGHAVGRGYPTFACVAYGLESKRQMALYHHLYSTVIKGFKSAWDEQKSCYGRLAPFLHGTKDRIVVNDRATPVNCSVSAPTRSCSRSVRPSASAFFASWSTRSSIKEGGRPFWSRFSSSPPVRSAAVTTMTSDDGSRNSRQWPPARCLRKKPVAWLRTETGSTKRN